MSTMFLLQCCSPSVVDTKMACRHSCSYWSRSSPAGLISILDGLFISFVPH